MDDRTIILELVGYLGSLLVGLSLTMSNIRKLRWINLFGASVFAVYGFLIQSWPVICLNTFIVITDVWHLYKMTLKNEFYSLLPLQDRPSAYLKRFIAFHDSEIQHFFPGFVLSDEGIEGWWVLRDMQPAGLFLFVRQSDHEVFIRIDYVTPSFRDMKTARWLFSEGLASFRKTGIKVLRTKATTTAHRRYLKTIGFKEDGDVFVLHLAQ